MARSQKKCKAVILTYEKNRVYIEHERKNDYEIG